MTVEGSRQHSADILPFGQPKDYPEGVRFIRPSHIAQANGDASDLIDQLRRREADHRPPFGECMVRFFRRHGDTITFWFAMFAIALLVGATVAAFFRAAR